MKVNVSVTVTAALFSFSSGIVHAAPSLDHAQLNPRAECTAVKIGSGDTCSKIATGCKISVENLYKYNSGLKEKCNSLQAGQRVCCTAGTMPDFRPKPNKDGTCVVGVIKAGQGCGPLASANELTVDEIEKLNYGKTWGFAGCSRVNPDQRICLSDGDPPFPNLLDNIDCGPQKKVEGATLPKTGVNISDMNPCPLNVCCNTWGYCGTTPAFCKATPVKKTPGTAEKDTNGCISNCGLDIVKGEPPFNIGKIGYYESWATNRDCLQMDVTEIQTSAWSHVHFAFGNITDDFAVDISGQKDQWDKFVKMGPFKRIISFGGWAFSNEPSTNHIIRNGVKPANRDKFVANLADFVKKYDIDGVDIDWEYPGATDIKGSDPGSPDDGPNYLKFLSALKKALPEGKTLSIAAPASYWYLKNFPIKNIGKVVDYIVYMTYDLHGQWDVGSKWAMEGCEGGDCVRSHVNKTETMWSLAMVTKAGVPTNKIYVGVSSYGRSFKLAEPGCTGFDCKFLGDRDNSEAAKGECTNTAGYISNAEIENIGLVSNLGWSDAPVKYWYDKDSDSDMLLYNSDQWVAYLNQSTKLSRMTDYMNLGFAGTVDWAIDLLDWGEGSDDSGDDDGKGGYEGMLDLSTNCPIDGKITTLDELDKQAGDIEPDCVAMLAVKVLRNMLDTSLTGYDDAADGYDDLFPTYEKYMKDTMDERITAWMWQPEKGTDPGFKYYTCYARQGLFLKKELNRADKVPCDDKPNETFSDYTYWYELNDEAGANKSLSAAGFDPAWIVPTDSKDTDDGDGTCDALSCPTETTWSYGYPGAKDDIELPNPKEVIDAARANMTNIQDEFDRVYIEIGLDDFDGSIQDAIDVLSVPISMLQDAVDAMKQVKELAKKIEAENKKNLILKIIEGILFLIPFVGGAIGGLGRVGASVARFMTAVGSGADAGLSIYQMIEDPAMAPVAILTMLLGGLGAPTGSIYRKLGKVKRDMTPEMKKNMGKAFGEINPKIESITGKMCKARK